MTETNKSKRARVCISEDKAGKYRSETIDIMFESIGGISSFIHEGSSVFIKINLDYPENYPTTCNPNLLKIVIEKCINAGASKVYIGGCSLFEISSEYIWISLGLSNYISKFNSLKEEQNSIVEFIPLESNQLENKMVIINEKSFRYPEIVATCDVLISLVNPKTNPVFQMDLVLSNSFSVVPYTQRFSPYLLTEKDAEIPKERKCAQEKFFNYWKNLIHDVYQIRTPDIVIIDYSVILANATPLIFTDSKFIQTPYLIMANNGVAAEILGLLMSNQNLADNPIICTLKERYTEGEFFTSISKSIESVELLQLNYEIELPHDFSKVEITKHNLLSATIAKINNSTSDSSIKSQNEKIFPSITSISSTMELKDVFPKRVEICAGEMCTGCRYGALNLLQFIKSSCIKDIENINGISLVIGYNPPDPTNEKNIIVFGDCAIQSTKGKDFYYTKKQKLALTREEIDKLISTKQGTIRNKILEWDNTKNMIRENINAEIKNDIKKQKAMESLEKRDLKNQEKFERKLNAVPIKMNKKHEKQLIREKKIRFKPNKTVVRIPGSPPLGFEYYQQIITAFRKTYVPTMNFWNQTMEVFYDRTKYRLFYRIFKKLNPIPKRQVGGKQ